jgi:hypothetical protein
MPTPGISIAGRKSSARQRTTLFVIRLAWRGHREHMERIVSRGFGRAPKPEARRKAQFATLIGQPASAGS